MKVLGISALFHDAAAALVVDGEVVAAVAEERLSRLKHDARLPQEAIAACLRRASLGIDDVDHVVFYEKPYRKFERIMTTSLRTFPRGMSQFVRAMGTWLGSRLWLEGTLTRALGLAEPDKLLFSDHHLSHAASAFLPSPYDRAAILTLDGVGEWNTTAIYRGETDATGSRIVPLAELHFPHSMGLLYSALTAYLGFRVNNGEYKVMGLASWGEPRFAQHFDKLVAIGEDASLRLNMRYFSFDRSPTHSFTPALEALLGPARSPDTPLDPAGSDPEARRFADIAATLQAVCERWMIAAARRARALTGEAKLCMAGGVALNCVANGRVARESDFDAVYVHPAAGDAGGALGAALYVSHVVGDVPRRREPLSPYLGVGYSPAQVEHFLRTCRLRHSRYDDDSRLYAEIARRLAAGEVGAFFQGRCEWGPRALGARSILADPTQPDMAGRVNARVKFREAFRPFAPAVLAEEAPRWFQVRPEDAQRDLTPHMLATVPLTAAGVASLPAICHVDGSARVQTVSADHHPALRAVLAAFRRETGVGVLLNTSLNLKGEPIATTPAEAYSVFDRSGLDFLVLEHCLVDKRRAA